MKLFVCMFVLASTWIAPAQATVEPDALVKETTDKVLHQFTLQREHLDGNSQKLFELVDQIVFPHFDFVLMAKLVLGKTHWKNASDMQREQFVHEFKALLVRTYATALYEYTGQEIIYQPLQKKAGANRVIVKTKLVPNDGPKIPLYYSLLKRGDERWKVYDVRIDGISLVTNYRSAYGQAINANGIDALIAALAKKNRSLATQ